MDSEELQAVSVVILGIRINDKLSFNLHTDNISLKSANQLNALVTQDQFLGIEERSLNE